MDTRNRQLAIHWATTGIVCAVMFFSALNFAFNDRYPYPEGAFVHLGLPPYFKVELTVAKFLGVFALLIPGIPRTLKEFAYFGFAITLISASIAHFAVGDGGRPPLYALSIIDPLIFLSVLAVSYSYFHKLGSRAGPLASIGVGRGIARRCGGSAMNWIALRMLTGDRSKYLGLIFGVTFATLLMTQQVSIFMGILTRTGNQILDVRDADIWVMDNRVRYLDEAPGLQEIDLMRVRGVSGVDWAVHTYKGIVRARLENGDTRNVRLTGLDDETLAAAPQEMIAGKIDDLKRPDSVIIDKAGYEYMWGQEPFRLGRTFQLNDRRAALVGVCSVAPPFFSDPIVYARYSQAARYVPRERNLMNYILVKPKAGVDQAELCRRIEETTGRLALTGRQFFWKTVAYFLASTGIPVNFGITITLGFIVGAAVTGQTLYLFVVESLKQFGALKAMGVPNRDILRMILLQSLLVGGVGYGLGAGLTAIFFITTGGFTPLAGLHMSWVALLGTGAAVVVIVIATSIFSARRVLLLEPAIVFRG